jgi:hypothetical protein
MEAAGISKGFASQVRAGAFNPHVATWPALASLVGVALPSASDTTGDSQGLALSG